MKTKFIKYVLPLIFSVGCLAGCGDEGGESGTDPVNPEYYKNYDLTLEGIWLENELQTLCFDTHKVFVRYGQVNSYYSQTSTHDSVEAVPSTINTKDRTCKNEWFYTGKVASGVGTREHVWPCANSDELWTHGGGSGGTHDVDNSNYTGGGSDLYHVRTANSAVNTARGNSKFVDFEDFPAIAGQAEPVTEKNGKYELLCQGFKTSSTGKIEYSQKVEVDDHMKGDVARILCYVYVHYGERGNAPKSTDKTKDYMLGNLSFTNILGYDSVSDCAQKLIEWNELDPVSDVEKHRNNAVQKIQGNRNPFVDYPNLVKQMLQDYIEL